MPFTCYPFRSRKGKRKPKPGSNAPDTSSQAGGTAQFPEVSSLVGGAAQMLGSSSAGGATQRAAVPSPVIGALGVQILSDPGAKVGGNAEVDIIAVHGLAGNSARTWTHPVTGRMWLRDFLPGNIPNARIMTYGYQSDPRSRNVLGIMENAEGLLEGLKVKRNGVEMRPLIFIGHSIGGLIIKKALLKARDQNNQLLEATFGIMFMGVPHNGADVANFATHLTAIVKIVVPLSDVNLDELKRDSRALADLSDMFGSIQDRFFYISVFESEKTAFPFMIRGSVMVVPNSSARLNLGNLELAKFSISGADHHHVCKFAEVDDQYEMVWVNLDKMVKKALAKPLLYPGPSSRVVSTPSERKRHMMLPFSRHKNFVGREEIFRQLDDKLLVDSYSHQRAALWGLGGIGKTQIALEFAYRTSEKSQKSIFWVHSSSVNRFEQDYRQIAKLVGIPGYEDLKLDVKSLVKEWFQSETTGDWVLIIDNADDHDTFFPNQKGSGQAVINGGETGNLFQYIPNGPTGTLLFTTRDFRLAGRLAGSVSDTIHVEKLDIAGGIQIFRHQLQAELYVEEDAVKLVEVLDHFPLAIAQAAAYARENGRTLSEYLDLYRESEEMQKDLLSEEFQDLRRDPAVTNSVMTTWRISFEQQSGLARHLLYIMSILDRQGIPRNLIKAAKPGTTVIDIDKALGSLVAFSFITPSQDRQSYEMHKLVQLAVGARLGRDRCMEYVAEALTLLSTNFPGDVYKNRETCDSYAPHAASVLEREVPDKLILHRSLLLSKYGTYVRLVIGKYGKAIKMQQQALDGREGALGPEHPDTLTSVNNLAEVLRQQGKYGEAEKMHRRGLDASERVLGPEHPDTLASVNNLALALRQQGKYEEAEKMHRRTLGARERVSGPEHPDTLASVNNLALVLGQQGKYGEAEKMHRRGLDARERVLGPEHPDTLTSVNNLAEVLRQQGGYEEAEKMHRRGLDARERVSGPEHPDTLTSVNNLALALRQQGKYEEAEKMHRRGLDARERVLGPEHPDTLISKLTLASVLRSQGGHESVELLYQQAHEGFVKCLGEAHPTTMECLRQWRSLVAHTG